MIIPNRAHIWGWNTTIFLTLDSYQDDYAQKEGFGVIHVGFHDYSYTCAFFISRIAK